MPHHTPKSLLTGCIPDLQSDFHAIHNEFLRQERRANRDWHCFKVFSCDISLDEALLTDVQLYHLRGSGTHSLPYALSTQQDNLRFKFIIPRRLSI